MTLKRRLFAAGALLGLDATLSYVAGPTITGKENINEKRKFAMFMLVLGQTVLGLPAALALLYGSGPHV